MIFNKNMQFFKVKHRNVWDYLMHRENNLENPAVQVIPAKNGQPNIKMDLEGKIVYLHSQYNPENEAEQWLEAFIDSAKEAKHIFFYGIGMGYHVEKLMKDSKKSYTIYEPDASVFYRFAQTRLFSDLPNKYLRKIFIGNSPEHIIPHFIEQFTADILIIINPAYERIYAEQTRHFIEVFKESIRLKLTNVKALEGYERLWTFNSEFNFKTVLRTQNMLEEKREFFVGKPVVLVAAGPSLEDEFDNLRYIKQHGLAYIFSVGSANRSLLAHDIYPDAVLSYDPNVYNHGVFSELIEKKIDVIPMIFGSSVGYETLKLYPGPMLHMITNQDHISKYYLNEPEVIYDAASIAIITLQLLAKMIVSTIILVGQNFAMRNNQYYSKGISYNARPTELLEAELDSLVDVESVDGGIVQTKEAHNYARKQMEYFIAQNSQIEIINTTKGGAAIKGAAFKEFDEVIKLKLKDKVVEEEWYKGEPTSYDKPFIESQLTKMDKEHEKFGDIMLRVVKILKKLEAHAATFQVKKTADMINQISNINTELFGNLYYRVYLEPMIRLHHDIFQKSLVEINPMKNVIEKARAIVKNFGLFLYNCQLVRNQNENIYLEHISDIKEHLEVVKID